MLRISSFELLIGVRKCVLARVFRFLLLYLRDNAHEIGEAAGACVHQVFRRYLSVDVRETRVYLALGLGRCVELLRVLCEHVDHLQDWEDGAALGVHFLLSFLNQVECLSQVLTK